MTLQSLANWLEYPGGMMGDGALGTSTTTMDAAGEGAAAVCVAPKSGNISKIGFMTGAVTSAQTLDARIETIDTSGNPSGTLWGTNTNGSQASPAANTWYWVTLTASAAVSRGEIFCVNIQWAGSAGNLQIRYLLTGPRANVSIPYPVANTGSWSKTNAPPLVAIEYDDGTRPHCGGFPINNTITSQSVSTTTTPDEVGAYFKVPFACKCSGIALKVGLAGAVTYAVKLYDSDGSTVLASRTGLDSDWRSGNSGLHAVLWTSEITLAKDTFYRATFLPETNNNHTFYRASIDSSGTLQSWPGGANFYWTQRTDAGAWTEDQTKVPQMALLISALDDGAGGGSAGILVNPGMRGGML